MPTGQEVEEVVIRMLDCIQHTLTKEETIDYISTNSNINPAFIELIWERLEVHNQVFMRAYNRRMARRMLVQQLLQQQPVHPYVQHSDAYQQPPVQPVSFQQPPVQPVGSLQAPVRLISFQQPPVHQSSGFQQAPVQLVSFQQPPVHQSSGFQQAPVQLVSFQQPPIVHHSGGSLQPPLHHPIGFQQAPLHPHVYGSNGSQQVYQHNGLQDYSSGSESE